MHKINDFDKQYGEQIATEYVDGISLKDLAKKYSVTTYLIRKVLNRHNITLRNMSEVSKAFHKDKTGIIGYCGRKHTLNVNAFDKINSKSAYILGFIYADGNVHKGQFTMALQRADRHILEAIKEFLEFTGEIKDKEVKCNGKVCLISEIRFHSSVLCEKLIKLGVVENKSLVLEFPKFLEKQYYPDFIRGYFDGDGCFDCNYPLNKQRIRTKILQLRTRINSGGYQFLEVIRDYLHQDCGLRNVKVTKNKIYEIAYSTFDSIKLHDILYYSDDVMCLKRKREKYDKAVKQRAIDIQNQNTK